MNWSNCPHCQKQKRSEKEHLKKSETCRKRQENLDQKLKNAGIPKRFQSKSFHNFAITNQHQKHNLDLCKIYSDRFEKVLELGTSLIFVGNVGTGKTHLATSIANEIIKKGFTVHFTDVLMMLSDVKHAQKSKDEKETEVIRNFALPDLLIIDEVGDQVGSDSDKRYLNKIINERYNQNKPTIILSNLPMKSDDDKNLKSFLGPRVIDRLRENSGKLLEFNWISNRSNIKSNLWD